MAPYKLTTITLFGLCFAASACNNSNFAGTSAKKAAASSNGSSPNGGPDGGPNGTNGGSGTTESRNGTSGSNGGTGPGGNNNNDDSGNSGGSINTNGGSIASANIDDPCAGAASQAAAANSLGTDAAAAKSILFYAPASYSSTGGEANTNLFVNGVVSGFTADGWQVKVITTASDSAVTLDACSLHKAYKQIWLWLPCNNVQNMDDASFAGLNKYFDYGGGVVVLTDNHFFIASNANTHCDPTDWAGGGTPSDAVRISQHMGFAVQSMAGAGGNATPDATHPLSMALSQINFDSHWNQNTITAIPTGALWLPVNKKGNYAALIDQTIAPPKGVAAKLGAVITPVYKYHVAPDDDDVKGLEAIATYFDAHEQVNMPAPAAAGAGLALAEGTHGTTHFDPSQFYSRAVPESDAQLRAMVRSGNKDQLGRALRRLAERGAINLDDLMAYNDDNRWFVRFSAAMAAGALPQASTVATLIATLQSPKLTPDLAIFCGRALAVDHGTSALPALQAAAAAFATAPYVEEHNAEGELLAAIGDLQAVSAQ